MDTDLVIRAQHGDEEAFASLAVAAGDRLHAVAHRILRDIDLAEDATQQALLTVWRDLPQLRDPARFDAWSYRLLVRACYAEARRTRRWAPNLRVLPADEPSGADDSNTVADRDQLERGFRRLSIDHRAVVVLHHYLDMPLDEVAETLGVPVGTVRSRLHHAMRGLRAALEADARPTSREAVPMSTDRDVTRIVRSWLEEGATALPDRVLDAVLDQVPATSQRRSWWPARRLNEMNNALKIAIVAAAVVVIAVVGFNLVPRQGGIGGPGPSPTASPRRQTPTQTPTPTPSPLPSGVLTEFPEGPLPAGTYTLAPYTAAGEGMCHVPPQSGCTETTADDTIRFTIDRPGWLDMRFGPWVMFESNQPPDRGRHGVHSRRLAVDRSMQVRLPVDPGRAHRRRLRQRGDEPSPASIRRRPLTSRWLGTPGSTSIFRSRRTSRSARSSQERRSLRSTAHGNPASTRRARASAGTMWVLDVDGVRVVVQSFDYAGTSAAHRAELQAIVNSIRIET